MQEHEGVLKGFLHGLSGRRLKIKAADQAYTDTETIFAPLLAGLPSPEQNFMLYKALIAGLWAQTGSVLFEQVCAKLSLLTDKPDVHCSCSTAWRPCAWKRLSQERCQELHRQQRYPRSGWRSSAICLGGAQGEVSGADCTASDVLAMVAVFPERLNPFAPFVYQGVLKLAKPKPASQRSE